MKDKILAFLNIIPIDKQLHILYGFAISYFTTFMLIVNNYEMELWQFGFIGLLISVFVAFAKEILDLHLDKWDVISTFIGGLLASLFNTILLYELC